MENLCVKNYTLICNDIFKQVNNVNYRMNNKINIYIHNPHLLNHNMIEHYDLSPKGVAKRKMIKIIDELMPSIKKIIEDPWGYWSSVCTPTNIPYDKIDKELTEIEINNKLIKILKEDM